MSVGNEGPATDRNNQPVVDPTANVLALVEAAVKRLDDLRAADKEMADLRERYDKELRSAESARIDAIRAVDVGAVNRAAEVSADLAATLANQVAVTATAFETKLASVLEPINTAIQDLRRAQYEAQGQKTQVVEQRGLNAQTLAILGLLITVAIVALGYIITT